jgi:hypothetical protein
MLWVRGNVTAKYPVCNLHPSAFLSHRADDRADGKRRGSDDWACFSTGLKDSGQYLWDTKHSGQYLSHRSMIGAGEVVDWNSRVQAIEYSVTTRPLLGTPSLLLDRY